MAKYVLIKIPQSETDIFQLQIANYKIIAENESKSLIFDSRESSLQDYIAVSGKEFADTPWEKIWFPKPKPDAPVCYDLIIKTRTLADISQPNRANSASLIIEPFISLLDIIRISEDLNYEDANNIRLFWRKNSLCLKYDTNAD